MQVGTEVMKIKNTCPMFSVNRISHVIHVPTSPKISP